MFDRLQFLIGEGLVALRRNGLMTFAAISTMAVSLFLIGGLGYTYMRFDDYAKTLPGKFEMRVFLRLGTSQAETSKAANIIRKMPSIESVQLIPKEGAWMREKQSHPEFTEGIDNPFPDAFKVRIKDLSKSDDIASQIRAMPQVDPEGGVRYLRDEQRFVDEAMQVLKWLGLMLGGLLFFTGGVLIYNAIQLTVISRALELRVMRLVGASRMTIRIPFLIEGMVQGLLGGLSATLLILAANGVMGNFLKSLNQQSILPPFPFRQVLLLLLAIGSAYGLVCSAIAVRGPLRK